jgi:dipeptidyl aminopeptidase/acylaminoacyl peptidase
MPQADPVAEATIRKLADARLIVTERDAASGRETVEVAHEALIRSWQRLRGWVDQDREFLRTRERVAAQARLWEAEGRPADRLLPPGRALAEGEDLLATRGADLEEGLAEYIRASSAAEASAKEAARAAQRRQLLRARLVAVAMLFLAIGAAGFAYWWQIEREKALLFADEAMQNSERAFKNLIMAQRNESRALAALAENEIERGSPATAVRMALAALPSSLTATGRPYAPQAEGALHRSLEQLRESRRFIGHEGAVWSVAFSPDGRTLATGSWDTTARLWDVETGKETAALRGHEGWVASVAFSPDGRTLATGSSDSTARLWDVETGKEIAVLRGHEGWVASVAFSADGRTLATGSLDSTARLWDVETGKEIAALRGHQGEVSSVAFSSDGRTLATGSDDTTARLWDVETGKEIAVLRGHEGWVASVAFSPDGRTLATGSLDSTARLWDVETGKEIAALRGHEREVSSVAFSPDGRALATGSGDTTAWLWPVGQGLVDLACARVHELPLPERDKERFGIGDEWCTPEVSARLRAELGMNGPKAAASPDTSAR